MTLHYLKTLSPQEPSGFSRAWTLGGEEYALIRFTDRSPRVKPEGFSFSELPCQGGGWNFIEFSAWKT
jgi:hypothetical protein